jgi:hypothetical protein
LQPLDEGIDRYFGLIGVPATPHAIGAFSQGAPSREMRGLVYERANSTKLKERYPGLIELPLLVLSNYSDRVRPGIDF